MFYLGFFLLILFGGFLVLLVILLFNPGQTVLGMQYFSYSESNIYQKTTNAAQTPLELATADKYQKIEINVDYASVIVEKNEDYNKDGVVIVNNSKGFVLAREAVKWEYSVLVEGNTLKINVKEPAAFLFFSKDIRVIVHIAKKSANPFSNTTFDITTKSASVTIGGSEDSPYAYDFNVGNVKMTSEAGSLKITKRVNYESEGEKQTFGSLLLSLGSGSFGPSAKELIVSDFGFISTSGSFAASKVSITNAGTIKTNSGTVKVEEVNGNLDIESQNGYFKFGKIVGNLNLPCADMKMDSSKFYIDEIDGDLTVIEGQNSNFEVKAVSGDVNMKLTSGKVKIGSGAEKYAAKSVVITTTTGSITVYMAGDGTYAKELDSQNGDIRFYLCGQVKGDVDVHTKTGRVFSYFMLGKSYTFTFSLYGSADAFNMKKVRFVDYPNVISTNPFVYNDDDVSNVKIYTNSNIELALFS